MHLPVYLTLKSICFSPDNLPLPRKASYIPNKSNSKHEEYY